MEQCCESYSQTESLKKDQKPISVWFWICSEFPRSSCSCRLPNSPNNLVHVERVLSLTKTSISAHLSLVLPLNMLSFLLYFTTSKTWKIFVMYWWFLYFIFWDSALGSRCPYKFPFFRRVRRCLPFVLFPKIWILSFFLSPHLRTFDFWA